MQQGGAAAAASEDSRLICPPKGKVIASPYKQIKIGCLLKGAHPNVSYPMSSYPNVS